MPSCRAPISSPIAPPERGIVRLSTYVVSRRLPRRAANDNRSRHASHRWHWALAVGIAPTLTALLLLTGLI